MQAFFFIRYPRHFVAGILTCLRAPCVMEDIPDLFGQVLHLCLTLLRRSLIFIVSIFSHLIMTLALMALRSGLFSDELRIIYEL